MWWVYSCETTTIIKIWNIFITPVSLCPFAVNFLTHSQAQAAANFLCIYSFVLKNVLDWEFRDITSTSGNFWVDLILEIGYREHEGPHSISLIPEETFPTFAQLGLSLPSTPSLLPPTTRDKKTKIRKLIPWPHLRPMKLGLLYIGTLALLFSKYQGVSRDWEPLP